MPTALAIVVLKYLPDSVRLILLMNDAIYEARSQFLRLASEQ